MPDGRAFLLLLLATLFPSPVAAQTDSVPPLQIGAHVRVRVEKLSPDWITGTIVTMQRTANRLAVRLNRTDAQGRGQYAFFTSVSAMEVDERTNQGYLVVGLSAPTARDWKAWSAEQIGVVARRCQR